MYMKINLLYLVIRYFIIFAKTLIFQAYHSVKYNNYLPLAELLLVAAIVSLMASSYEDAAVILGGPEVGGAPGDEGVGTTFWDVGQYKRTVRRLEDAHRLASDYAAFVQERGSLEESYAKALRGWAKKWAEKMDRGPEYGTMQLGWKAPLEEAEKLAQVHLNIRDRLTNEVSRHLKEWQKENFHKSVVPMNQVKEAKEMDETFRKTQKPWAKLYKKVLEAKKAYHLACKYERTAINQEANARADTSKSPEEQKRLREKVERCKEEVLRAREKYEVSLHDLNGYNAKYMEDMKEVFEKCQRMEEARMTFFKGILLNLHKGLDITQYEELPRAYDDLRSAIERIDVNKDLTAFSNAYGVGMPMNWPIFEEYSPELHSISSKKGLKSSGSVDFDGVTLTGIVQKEKALDAHAPPGNGIAHYDAHTYDSRQHNSGGSNTPSRAPPRARSNYGYYEARASGFNNAHSGRSGSDDAASNFSSGGAHALKAPTRGTERNSSPFEDDLDEPETALEHDAHASSNARAHDHNDKSSSVDARRPSVPVRALYDYEGQETDELSFKRGDEFEKLEDEDEQGWCKGRIGKKIGLYPAEYVEVI